MKLYTKSDVVERLKPFYDISSSCGGKCEGVKFIGNCAYVEDEKAVGRVIVRDGRYDSDLFYEYGTDETFFAGKETPSVPARDKFLVFVHKPRFLSFIESLGIQRRKLLKTKLQIEICKTEIHFKVFAAKGDCLGSFSQRIFLDKRKRDNIVIGEFQITIPLYYFYGILKNIFLEYSIVGLRYGEQGRICIFGKNHRKPNINFCIFGT